MTNQPPTYQINYPSDGQQKNYPITFPYHLASQITVSISDANSQRRLQQGQDYQVNTALVVLSEAVPRGNSIIIQRVTPRVRTTVFDTNTILDLRVLDTELTLLLHMIQELSAPRLQQMAPPDSGTS